MDDDAGLRLNWFIMQGQEIKTGGEGGIRTLDTGVSPYNGLANAICRSLALVFSNSALLKTA